MASKYFSMNFSALFEAYNYGQIQGLELGEVILALNGKGVYVLDSRLTLIYAQFKFHDLLYASAIKYVKTCETPIYDTLKSFQNLEGKTSMHLQC